MTRWFTARAESTCDRGLGMPVQLDGILLTKPVHALTVPSPEIFGEEPSMFGRPVDKLGPTTLFTGGVILFTWVTGGGDHNTGTIGTCVGELVNALHSSVPLYAVLVNILGILDTQCSGDVCLPIPGIERLIAFPLETLEVLVFIVLANSLWVPLGGSLTVPLGICKLEQQVTHFVFILKENGIVSCWALTKLMQWISHDN